MNKKHDPNGPPEGMSSFRFEWEEQEEANSLMKNTLEWAGATAIAGAATLFVLTAGLSTRTAGATHSTKLKWEKRQQEIEQVIQETENTELSLKKESDRLPTPREKRNASDGSNN